MIKEIEYPEDRMNECYEAIVDLCREYLAEGKMNDRALAKWLAKLDKEWENMVQAFIGAVDAAE